MAESAQPRICSDCERDSTELDTCDGCLSQVCPRCYPPHKLPRKCKLLEARRQLRSFQQSSEMKRRIREKGKEWRLANEIISAKMQNLETQKARIVEDMQGKMNACRTAAQFVHKRVDILDKKEVTDLPGWIKHSSLHHIQDENEGMLETVERITNSLLDTMRNLPDRLVEEPELQIVVVERVVKQLDQCTRILQGVDVDQKETQNQDQILARRQDEEPGTRDAGTRTGAVHGQDHFTQTDLTGQTQFTPTDEAHRQDNYTQTDTRGEDKFTQTETTRRDNWTQTGRLGRIERLTRRLLPGGLVFLLVLLTAVTLQAMLHTRWTAERSPKSGETDETMTQGLKTGKSTTSDSGETGKSMTLNDYRRMRVTSVIKPSVHVKNLTWIYDTATCPVTGRVYVSGRRDGKDDRVVILVFDRGMTFVRYFITDINSVESYISVSPAGELLVTIPRSTQISFLDRDGRLVRRVETGSRCSRCVSDGHRLYVSHPDRDCVTVFDYQGRQIRQIGGDVLRFPLFLTINKAHLYVTDMSTESLHVFTTDGDPVRDISTAGHVTTIRSRGVHVDGAGHVLLADMKNKCIHVYGEDGTWIHTLRDDRINLPGGLTQTPGGDLVLVNIYPPSLFIFKTE